MPQHGRLKKMFVAIFFGRGIMAARQLIAVPILLSTWGADYYGSWLLLSTIPIFLSTSNFGIGTTANIQIATSISNKQDLEARTIFSYAQIFILGMGIIVALSAYGLTYIFANNSTISNESSAIVVGALTATAFFHMAAMPLLGWWTGNGKPATGYQYINVGSIVAFAITIAVPSLAGNASALAMSLMIWEIIWLLSFHRATSTAFGKVSRPLPLPIQPEIIRKLIKTGIGHQLGTLWQPLLHQGTLLLAGSLMGPSGAALWSALKTITRSGNQVLEIICQSISPEIQIANGANQYGKIRKLHARGLFISIAISCLLVLFLFFFGPYLFQLWTSGVFELDPIIFRIMSASIIPAAIWMISAEIQRSTNNPWKLNIYSFVSLAIAYPFTLFFAQATLLPLAIATFVFDLALVMLIIPTTLRLINSSLYDLVFELAGVVQRRNWWK